MKFYLINNTSWQVSEAFLKWLFRSLAKELKPMKKHQKALSKTTGVVIVGAKKMSALNKRYRGKNGPTDVLSFESGDEVNAATAEGGFLGDIVICYEKVIQQAKVHDLHPSEEFCYLVLHGLLHLLGYDHETSAKEEKKMFRLQDNVFAVLQDKDILKVFKRLNSQSTQSEF